MFDWSSLLKYILEGIAVAVATFLIPSKKLDCTDIVVISLTAAAVFAVLDQFSPLVAGGARQGTGFSIGYQQVGLGDDPAVESNSAEPSPSPVSDSSDICHMLDGDCTYSPNATPEDQQKFLCKKVDDNCVAESVGVEGFEGF